MTPVVEKSMSRLLHNGIIHKEVGKITQSLEEISVSCVSPNSSGQLETFNTDAPSTINSETINPNTSTAIGEELEEIRLRKQDLTKQISELQEMLKKSRDWLGLDDRHFRDAISASLEF